MRFSLVLIVIEKIWRCNLGIDISIGIAKCDVLKARFSMRYRSVSGPSHQQLAHHDCRRGSCNCIPSKVSWNVSGASGIGVFTRNIIILKLLSNWWDNFPNHLAFWLYKIQVGTCWWGWFYPQAFWAKGLSMLGMGWLNFSCLTCLSLSNSKVNPDASSFSLKSRLSDR